MSGRLQRWLGPFPRTVSNFWTDNCLDLAATVAFYSLLALGPLLYLLGAGLGRLLRDEGALERAVERLSLFLPAEAAEALGRLLPELVGGGRFVILALPALLWVGSSSFSSLEYAINVAFGRATGRRFWHSRAKGFAVLLAGFVLIGGSLFLEAALPRLAADRLAEWGTLAVLLVATFVTLCLFYKLLPHGRIGWAPACAGAGLGLVLLEAARRLFGGFLVRSPGFGVLNGTVAAIVAVLLWVYAAVAVILLGAELAALLNGNRGPWRADRGASRGEA